MRGSRSGNTVSMVVAEDDALLRHLLRCQLNSQEGYRVLRSVGNGREAVQAVAALKPRLLLLDLDLPEPSGLEVLEQLLTLEAPPSVLVLSGEEREETQLEAARRGASGFLCKSQAGLSLLPAIHAVAAGEAWASPRLVRRILDEYSPLARRAREGAAPVKSLTPAERDVLVRLGRGMTNPQIASELRVSISTVKVHVQSIFRKLELRNRAEAAVVAEREGLLIGADVP